MTRAKIKQITAVLLILFIIFIFSLSIYFAIKGNITASLSALAFNGFFAIVLFFLIKFHRYITSNENDENVRK